MRPISKSRRSVRVIAALLALAILNTLALLPATAQESLGSGGFYVVSFDSRITDADRTALARTGAVIIDYEPDNSYIVWADEAQATAASRLSGAERIRPLTTNRKLDDALDSTRGLIEPANVTVYGPKIDEAVAFLSEFGDVIDFAPIRADGLLYSVRVPLGASVSRRGSRSSGRDVRESWITPCGSRGRAGNADHRRQRQSTLAGAGHISGIYTVAQEGETQR